MHDNIFDSSVLSLFPLEFLALQLCNGRKLFFQNSIQHLSRAFQCFIHFALSIFFYHFSSCFICQSPSFKKWITSMPMPLFVARLLKTKNNKIALTCIHISQGVLCKVLHREGPTPFLFVDHIVIVGIPFIYLYLKKKRYPFCS